ncbi:hypothetical protein KIPB_001103 [Kipferlia bialata]|uniref:Kinesin motor domain-containing protein n=1 Tax=Kipferlia bialata TaxID=797122 RepID=A0A9K3GEY9_9EUKA|nr:hypothetical protein KIPB_001103 [Kipferlia bialata]|eukprot:g1103.t1
MLPGSEERNSVLTRMLQRAFLGQAALSIVTCVGPTADTLAPSLGTLGWASRALSMKVDTKAKEVAKPTASDLTDEVTTLRCLLQDKDVRIHELAARVHMLESQCNELRQRDREKDRARQQQQPRVPQVPMVPYHAPQHRGRQVKPSTNPYARPQKKPQRPEDAYQTAPSLVSLRRHYQRDPARSRPEQPPDPYTQAGSMDRVRLPMSLHQQSLPTPPATVHGASHISQHNTNQSILSSHSIHSARHSVIHSAGSVRSGGSTPKSGLIGDISDSDLSGISESLLDLPYLAVVPTLSQPVSSRRLEVASPRRNLQLARERERDSHRERERDRDHIDSHRERETTIVQSLQAASDMPDQRERERERVETQRRDPRREGRAISINVRERERDRRRTLERTLERMGSNISSSGSSIGSIGVQYPSLRSPGEGRGGGVFPHQYPQSMPRKKSRGELTMKYSSLLRAYAALPPTKVAPPPNRERHRVK